MLPCLFRHTKNKNPTGKLSHLFATRNNKDDVTIESSDADVEKFIRKQSGDAINRTYIIQSRIDQFGTKQPNGHFRAK